MGSQESKSAEQYPKQSEQTKETNFDDNKDDSVPSTPILTPLDPRSPSANIARTPLELILGAKTQVEECVEVVEEEEVVTKNVVLHVDPRSPTAEFNRTPIIVATTVKEKPLKLNNKNLDNVRRSTIQTTPVGSARISSIKPPKLLGSSPLAVNPNAHKRRSLVGLLETNIDFTETDLDSVSKKHEDLIEETEQDSCDSTHLNSELANQMEFLGIKPEEESAVQTPKADQKNDSENGNEKLEEKVEEEESKISPCVDEVDNILEEKSINITAHVKDFDKKLTNLIYQDESDDDEDNKLGLRLTRIKENNRTPLGTRNANEEPKKAASRLRVSDKPRKIEISKIPVFKDNYGKKMGIQCENTPPKKMEEKRMRAKISQWDTDKTLII